MKELKVGEPVEVTTGSKPIGIISKTTKNFIRIRSVQNSKHLGYLVIKKEKVKRDKVVKVMAELI